MKIKSDELWLQRMGYEVRDGKAWRHVIIRNPENGVEKEFSTAKAARKQLHRLRMKEQRKI